MDDIDKCLINRQYGYISLYFEDIDLLQNKLDYISLNKNKINYNYPILIRLICSKGVSSLMLPDKAQLKSKLTESEMLIKIS